MSRFIASMKKVTLIVVVFLLFSHFSGLFLELHSCERAFFRCLRDPFTKISLTGPIYCGIGYLFCKKYIEKI